MGSLVDKVSFVSGNTSYVDAVKKGKNFTILCDSVIIGMKWNEMNKQTKENSHLKTFRVATCTDVLSYVEPTLDRANLMELLFMWELMMYQGKVKDLVILLIQLCQLVKCRDTGVRNVMISSLVWRKNPSLQVKINEVNDVLRDLCVIDYFVFTDNANHSDCDISEDLLHLSRYSGTCKLATNFIGGTNKKVEKSSFWQSSVISSKRGSVSASEKSPEKSSL